MRTKESDHSKILKNSIGNWNRDLQSCGEVSQPTAPPKNNICIKKTKNYLKNTSVISWRNCVLQSNDEWDNMGTGTLFLMHLPGVDIRVLTTKPLDLPGKNRFSCSTLEATFSVRYQMALGQDWRYLLPHTLVWLAHTVSFVIPSPRTSDIWL